ncbi:MAG: pyrroline-5-carboxylate reductase [Pseudomonadota bacterium]|nr:pyrroline-5-carboxylate reductase [Pseudomonadota bacterium]
MKEPIFAFIGGGNMGRCLVGGLIGDGHPCDRLRVSDPDPARLQVLRELFGVRTGNDNRSILAGADVVILAVKPQMVRAVVEDVAETLRAQGPLVLSIVAGLSTRVLRRWIGPEVPIVRAMPNTPALVRSGAAALYAETGSVGPGHRNSAESILRAVGSTVWVEDEALMDTVTALSGSGPAYFFLFMELIERAGVSMGLAPESARLLTLQTAFGAAKMALESETPAAVLRAQVTSPGGTTEQAIKTFQDCGIESIVTRALRAAEARSRELGACLGES